MATVGKILAVMIGVVLFVGGFCAFIGGFFMPGVDGLKLLVAGIAMCAFGLKIGDEMRSGSIDTD